MKKPPGLRRGLFLRDPLYLVGALEDNVDMDESTLILSHCHPHESRADCALMQTPVRFCIEGPTANSRNLEINAANLMGVGPSQPPSLLAPGAVFSPPVPGANRS